MKRLKSRYVTPPGGWRYVDPDTGFLFNEQIYPSFHALLAHISRYREQNHLPEISKVEVEDWLCCQPNMERHCREYSSRSVLQYARGAKAAAKVRLGGEEVFTSQQVAELRAWLCTECPHNKVDPYASKFKQYSDGYIKSLVGQRRTLLDDKLFSCGVCSCLLRSKVHINQNIVSSSLSRREARILSKPITSVRDGKLFYCWQTHPVLTPTPEGLPHA